MSNRKRIMKALSAVTALTIVAGLTAGTGALINAALAGDANGDGAVNSEDIKTLGSYIVGSSDNVSAYADINGDGAINVFDMVSLRRTVMQNPVSDVNYIHLKGSSISIDGTNMTLTGNNVVTITASGTYYVDGTLTDGQIIVNVPDETVDAETVKIFLNGVNITGTTASAIFVENAENTSINLVKGTTNYLSDGSTAYSGDYLECGVLHAKDDMTIKGDGILNVTANTQYAIQCNNDLKFTGGTVNATSVLEDAIRGKKSVTVKDGVINVDSAGDGIKSTKGSVTISGGTVTAKAENDAIQSEAEMQISGEAKVYAYAKRSLTTVDGYTVDITGGTVVATSNEEFTNTAGITVNSMLLNYTEKIDKQEIAIKKNGSTVYSVKPDKKYTYALICNSSLSSGTYNVFTGTSQMTHSAAATAGEFITNATVSTFNAVAAMSGAVVTTDNTITLASSGITFVGSGATVSADKKTVTVSNPGTYIVVGEMTGGQIIVDVDKTAFVDATVELSLEGMSLTNTATSPIYIASVDDKCSISAKKGTVNTITDGTSYTNADEGVGAIYSKDDLTFKGKGTLNVIGNCEDAIVSKNDIKINNSTLNVTAVDDGIRGKDSVTIGDAADTDYSALNVTVKTTGGDGIKSTEDDDEAKGYVTVNGGTIKITSNADGIQAERNLTINGGDLDIYTYQGSTFKGTATGTGGGGRGGMQEGNSNKTEESAKGLKCGDTDLSIAGDITINDGNIKINSSDDSIHCGGKLNMIGGKFELASADDGIHSDSELIIGTTGNATDYNTPYIDITYSYEGVEAANITQNSGTVMVTATDDGYNAAGGTDSSGTTNPGGWGQGGFNPGGSTSGGDYNLIINGGYTYVNAAGDGLDSNGNLTVNGGYVFVSQTGGGNSPIDCDNQWAYNGGVVVAGGSSDMFSESIPAKYNFLSTTSVSAGSTITFTNSSGTVVATMTFANASAEMVMCSSDSSVTCYSGGTVSGATYFSTSNSTNKNMKAGYGGTISGGTTLSSTTSGGGTGPGGR